MKVLTFLFSVLSLICPILETKSLENKPSIIGGEEAQPGEFPYLVAIFEQDGETKESEAFLCVGILIQEYVVLTSGSCLLLMENSSLTKANIKHHVYAGVHNISEISFDSNVQLSEPAILIPHPRYDPNSNQQNIGLIFLSNNFTMTEMVNKIALPNKKDCMEEENTHGTVVGWGGTDTSGEITPILQKVQVPIKDDTCPCSIEITEDCKFQAGDPNHDVSSNDLGSPFLLETESEVVPFGVYSHKGPCNNVIINDCSSYTSLPQNAYWIQAELASHSPPSPPSVSTDYTEATTENIGNTSVETTPEESFFSTEVDSTSATAMQTSTAEPSSESSEEYKTSTESKGVSIVATHLLLVLLSIVTMF